MASEADLAGEMFITNQLNEATMAVMIMTRLALTAPVLFPDAGIREQNIQLAVSRELLGN